MLRKFFWKINNPKGAGLGGVVKSMGTTTVSGNDNGVRS